MALFDLQKFGASFAASLATNGQPIADNLLAKAMADLQPMADEMEQRALDAARADEQLGIAQLGIIGSALVDKLIALKDICEFNFTLQNGRVKFTIDPKEKS
jgi:hypothetical protein